MKLRTFTVPFTDVAPDAQELEFGPSDVLTVRPLFSLPQGQIAEWAERIRQTETAAEAAIELPVDDPVRVKAEEASDLLILDMIRTAVVSWSLTGPDDKPIDVPKTPADLDALPGGLAGRLYPFLSVFRGPNPTTRS